MRVLVVNAGSSSVNLRLVDEKDELAEGIDLGPPDGGISDELAKFIRPLADRIDVAGHRVVPGGPHYSGAVEVDDATKPTWKT